MTRIINGTEVCAGAGGFFAYAGSFGISKKILLRAGHIMDRTDIKNVIAFKWVESLFHVCAGSWNELPHFDDTAVVHAVRSGKFWDATLYVFWHALQNSQGRFGEAERLIATLSELANCYDHDVARLYAYMLQTDLFFKRFDLRKAESQAEDGLSFTSKEGMEPFQTWFAGYRGMIQVMMSEVDQAEVSLRQAEGLIAKQGYVTPMILIPYQTARFYVLID